MHQKCILSQKFLGSHLELICPVSAQNILVTTKIIRIKLVRIKTLYLVYLNLIFGQMMCLWAFYKCKPILHFQIQGFKYFCKVELLLQKKYTVSFHYHCILLSSLPSQGCKVLSTENIEKDKEVNDQSLTTAL